MFAKIIHTMKKPIIDLNWFGGVIIREVNPSQPFKTGAKLVGFKPMVKPVKAENK